MVAVADLATSPVPHSAVDLVRYAVMAPSALNAQPWRFAVDGRVVRILPDLRRRLPMVDPVDRALFIGLGCALENLVVAARQTGYDPVVDLLPDGEPDGCLRVRLVPAAPVASPLFDAIPRRQTNRRHYDGRPIPEEDLAHLAAVAADPGVSVRVLSAQAAVDVAADLVGEADRRQLEDDDFRAEVSTWTRFNAAEAQALGDGLPAAALETPDVPRWVGEWALRFVLTGERQAVKDRRLIHSSAALALVTTTSDDRVAWVSAGRTFERFALTATTLGVQLAHVSAPCEVEALRGALTRRLGVEGHAQLLVRLGYAAPLPRAPRRPLEAVLVA